MTATLTQFCHSTSWVCELCGTRGATTVARATGFGPACINLCPSCQALPEPIRTHTAAAAHEHREHLTRAADLADPRRGAS